MAPNDRTTDPSAAKPPAEAVLKPQLQRALNNLNIHLEDELTHYRRQMQGQAPPPAAKLKIDKVQKQGIDLISVKANEVKPTEVQKAEVQKAEAQKAEAQKAEAQKKIEAQTSPRAAVVLPPPPPNPFLKDRADEDTVSPPEQHDVADSVGDISAVDELAMSGPEVTGNADAGIDAVSDLLVRQATNSPEGYLESSEELLKSLADDPVGDGVAQAPAKPYRPGSLSRFTTPLGMGLLLLFMVGSLGIGYLMLNPSALDSIRALFQSPSETADQEGLPDEGEATEGTAITGETLAEGTSAESGEFSPPGPDLSQREFVELDLDSLSTLDVDGGSKGPTVPVVPTTPPVATPAPLPNTTTQLPAPGTAQLPAPGTTAPGTSSAPAPAVAPTAPTTAAPAPAAPVAPATGSNYYVVTSYTGDPSLTKARETVTDAFVRNFKDGTRIQLGAFDNAETAQQYVQELQQQGMASQLYGPTDE